MFQCGELEIARPRADACAAIVLYEVGTPNESARYTNKRKITVPSSGFDPKPSV